MLIKYLLVFILFGVILFSSCGQSNPNSKDNDNEKTEIIKEDEGIGKIEEKKEPIKEVEKKKKNVENHPLMQELSGIKTFLDLTQKNYKSVVLYTADGNHHYGFCSKINEMKLDSIKLNLPQIQRLFKAIETQSFGEESSADCYYPRHIFVFYDNQDIQIAAIGICFECNNVVTCPYTWGSCTTSSSFKSLVKDIGFPLFNDFPEFTEYLENFRKKSKK